MAQVALTPVDLLKLVFGSEAEIAEICGLSRAQTPRRWDRVPQAYFEVLVEASRTKGSFPITYEMLVRGATITVSAPVEIAAQ